MHVGRRTVMRLVAAGLTGVLTLGVAGPVAAVAAPRVAAEDTRAGETVDICKYAPAVKAELNRALRWLDKVQALAPASWDAAIERARQAINTAKQRLANLVQSGHCNVSVERLCSYTDEAKRVFTRVDKLLTWAIAHSSGELKRVLQQGRAHLRDLARYVARLAEAHC